MKNFITSTLGAVTMLAVSSVANAYETTSLDCSAAVMVPSYDNCVGSFSLGNGENDVTNGGAQDIASQLLNVDAVFGDPSWFFIDKQDTLQGVSLFTIDSINDTSGTVTFNVDLFNSLFGGDFLTDYDLVLSFKAGNNFSMYQWDGSLDTNVFEWSTAGTGVNFKGDPKDLSHGSAFARSIQVHEAGIFMLFGIGVSGLLISRLKLV